MKPMEIGSARSAISMPQDEWKEVMAANGLAPLDLQGADFQNFVAESVGQIQTISKEIGIIK